MDQSESLIETGQMELIPSTEIHNDEITALETASPSHRRNPEFTAARFYAKHPEKYRELVSLRAEGVPIASLARVYHVSEHTIVAIDEREGTSATVAELKKKAAGGYRRLAAIGRERLEGA